MEKKHIERLAETWGDIRSSFLLKLNQDEKLGYYTAMTAANDKLGQIYTPEEIYNELKKLFQENEI